MVSLAAGVPGEGLVRRRWQRMGKGRRPWDTKQLPLYLPFDHEAYQGHRPSGCHGPRVRPGTPAAGYKRGRRWLCNDYLLCGFCWQRRQLLNGARAIRDHLGNPTIHFSTRAFTAQDDPEQLLVARDALWSWLKDKGFRTINLGVHVFGASMRQPDPHFDVVASGPDPDLRWRHKRRYLEPLREWQEPFIKKHGGFSFYAKPLPDGFSDTAAKARHHAGRYARRCTLDVPVLLAGRFDAENGAGAMVYSLRERQPERLWILAPGRVEERIDEHAAWWMACPPRDSRPPRGAWDQDRRRKADHVVRRFIERYAYRWHLDGLFD